jgi:MFS family permease
MLINPSPSHTNNDRDGPMNGSSSSSSSGPNPSATATRETVFLVLITLTQLVQSIPLGAGINSGLAIGSSLGSPPSSAAWIVASYPLTQGAFVLIGGRLGEVYGHKAVLAAGALWWTVWAFAGGYATNLVSMCLLRGLCGIGGGLMVPNVVGLIGLAFPPGRKRNLGMALFGAMAPVGAAGGSVVAAVVVQLAGWKWLFFML